MKLYPTICRPLYRNEEPQVKKTQTRKYNSVKKIATVRNNTGIVNNADQHISEGTVIFINWLGSVMEDITKYAQFMTAADFSKYAKILSNKHSRFMARDLARKRKAMFQEHIALPETEEDEFLVNKAKNMRLLTLQLANAEYKKQLAKNAENLKTKAWVEAHRLSK